MSSAATEWAWAQRVGAHQKLVLLAIADFASAAGVAATVPVALVKQRTGLKEGQVLRAADELVEARLLTVDAEGPHPTWMLPIG